jgi:hypothetical protein
MRSSPGEVSVALPMVVYNLHCDSHSIQTESGYGHAEGDARSAQFSSS